MEEDGGQTEFDDLEDNNNTAVKSSAKAIPVNQTSSQSNTQNGQVSSTIALTDKQRRALIREEYLNKPPN